MFGNVVGVEDLVQDSFLRAYLDLERLRDPARFGAWVRSIAVNLARMAAPILVAPEVMEEEGVVVEDGDDFLPREVGEAWVSLLQS